MLHCHKRGTVQAWDAISPTQGGFWRSRGVDQMVASKKNKTKTKTPPGCGLALHAVLQSRADMRKLTNVNCWRLDVNSRGRGILPV